MAKVRTSEEAVAKTSEAADVRKAGEKLTFAKAWRIEPQDIDISTDGPTDIRSADYCVEIDGVLTPMTKGQFGRGWVPVDHSDAQTLQG